MSVLSDKANVLSGFWGSKSNPLVGPVAVTIPAGVFTPEYPVNVTDAGTAAMTGLTVPYPDFQGFVYFIPGGAFTWTTATNIAAAGTAVVGKIVGFFYNPITAKWYASI